MGNHIKGFPDIQEPEQKCIKRFLHLGEVVMIARHKNKTTNGFSSLTLRQILPHLFMRTNAFDSMDCLYTMWMTSECYGENKTKPTDLFKTKF
jgi:vacuolar-type H+-ATPase catalytic subunit A/Vma1